GGAIVQYNPRQGTIAKISIPLPHVYIQSIALDAQREIIYCQCFAPEKLASFNLRSGEVKDFGLIGTGIAGMCQPENLRLVDSGKAEYLFTPITDRPSRLAAMALGKDGCAYGVTGRQGHCDLLRFDFRQNKFELLGQIAEPGGEACFQVHHVIFADDGTLYA